MLEAIFRLHETLDHAIDLTVNTQCQIFEARLIWFLLLRNKSIEVVIET